ncbi:MAG TPA: GTPase [Gemmataceae bacterium]|nr:GTPase [Gemmataceae bacterium]
MSRPTPESVTWVACLTPPGSAAIATLALFGPDAWNVAQQLFRPASRSGAGLPAEPEEGRFWFGRFGEGLADEVVLAVKRGGPVPWLELHCHGGREVLRLLGDLLAARGVRSCSWQEFERRATGDALRAAAAGALAEAPTSRTAAILLDQYQGAFHRAVTAVLAALERGDLGEADRQLTALARHADLGRHLTAGWRVVVAGAANVGKSSLVNALAGYQRSIVSATPGTTRDVVTTRIAVDGWPIELADTAGLRAEAAALEGQGIERARAAAAAADLCLWVLDAAGVPVWPGAEAGPAPAGKTRLLINKIDLPPAWDLDQAKDAVRVSARTGAGLAELCEALARWLVPDPPPPGAAVPFTTRLATRIEEARRQLAAGRAEEARQILKMVAEDGPAR